MAAGMLPSKNAYLTSGNEMTEVANRPALRRPRHSGAVGGAGGGQDRPEAGTFPPARAGEPVAGLGRRAGPPATCGAGACAARGVAVVSGPDERAFDGNHSGAGDVFALAHA